MKNICLNLVIGICLPAIALAQSTPLDLTGSSLEDLMNMRVTSLSKRDQSLSKAAGSIYVITQEDIRRSGANNVPDLLRMVPGVDVARIDAHTWAISIRGFNYRYSDKVLVLVDGRSVYSPLFSGVYWDEQSMPLENIARVEVIRGPGGTVWGANAMNGVINIITKSAQDTQGGLITAAAGLQDTAQGLAQYGGTAGAKGYYRAYSRYTMTLGDAAVEGWPAVGGGHTTQIGFRADWNFSRRDKVTIQGDMLGSSGTQTVTTPFSNRLPDHGVFVDNLQDNTANILGRWNHVFSNGSETTVQLYYDRTRRFDAGLNVVNTGDVDFQYHFHLGDRHDIVAGLGYRKTDQTWAGGYAVSIGTGHGQEQLFSSFVQDQISVTNSLALTIGVKVEQNDYTGFEYEPSAQLAWSPTSRHTVWASAAKAIQQPSWGWSQNQADAVVLPTPDGGSMVVHVSGNPQALAARLFNYEVGYRTELSKRLTLDTTAYWGDYDRLRTLERQTPFFSPNPAPGHLVLPELYENLGRARNRGVEFSAHVELAKWWRISPGFSFLQMNVSQDPRSQDITFPNTPGDSPNHQVQLRSTIKLPHNLEWDTSAYYVGRLATGSVAAYTRLDTRIGWRFGENVELSLTGQNLLSPRHLEFFDGLRIIPTYVTRDAIVKLTWRF